MKELQLRMDKVRQKAIATVDDLLLKGTEFQLPAPTDALAMFRQRLVENFYNVLVVGEVKRGKSSFINALIGQNILPTNVDVATSQVFRICPSEKEAYRIRFEDESVMHIRREELPRYGSQIVADSDDAPRLDQIIRWIEVDVPLRNVPPGIRIFDTPGLGGLYAHHAEITMRLIPQAAAVIYVLDSTRPIVENDLEYLDEILKQTKSVFFIQTKFDLYRMHNWLEIQKRNEEILRERLREHQVDCRVWPISSELLSKAVDDPDYEIVSKHRELAPALQTFLLKVSGIIRVAECVILSTDVHNKGSQVLSARRSALIEKSNTGRETLAKELTDRNAKFQEDWGERGKERKKLREAISDITKLSKAHMTQFLGVSGQLHVTLQKEVDSATEMDQLRTLADGLANKAVAIAAKEWRKVAQDAWNDCVEKLTPFMEAVDKVTAPESVPQENDQRDNAEGVEEIQLNRDLLRNRDLLMKLKTARNDFMAGAWAGGTVSTVLIFTFPPLAPVAGLFAVVSGFWAVIRGAQNQEQAQIQTARHELRAHISLICTKIRQQYLDVCKAQGRYSQVDEHLRACEKITDQKIDEIVANKETESKAEAARLKKDAELSESARKSELEKLHGIIKTWNALGQQVKLTGEELKQLENEIEQLKAGDEKSQR